MSFHDTVGVPNPAGYRDVPLEQLPVPLPAGLTVIDVRQPDEFVGPLGHIPGAQLVPLAALLAQSVTWDKDADYLLVCASGGRSSRAAQALRQAGFSRVMNLPGGMHAWNAAQRPVER